MKEVREPPSEYLEEECPGQWGQQMQRQVIGSGSNKKLRATGAEGAREKAVGGEVQKATRSQS